MKNNYYLPLFVVLITVSAKAQTNWLILKFDKKLAIIFPSETVKKIGNGSGSDVS